jgi:KRAB domain-containing zinc finger protein
VHSGEKPYGCRYCEYRAAQASAIIIHERVHSGEKPFSCSVCDYRAAASPAVRRHERSKHDL